LQLLKQTSSFFKMTSVQQVSVGDAFAGKAKVVVIAAVQL